MVHRIIFNCSFLRPPYILCLACDDSTILSLWFCEWVGLITIWVVSSSTHACIHRTNVLRIFVTVSQRFNTDSNLCTVYGDFRSNTTSPVFYNPSPITENLSIQWIHLKWIPLRSNKGIKLYDSTKHSEF